MLDEIFPIRALTWLTRQVADVVLLEILMRFHGTELAGAYVIELEELSDARGFFARTWCAHEFENHGLPPHMAQSSLSFNRKRGTLRGLHFEAPPAHEGKLVRCTTGAIFDVIVDIRPASNSFRRHLSVVLSADNRRSVYVPPGFAHGFQTLVDNTEVMYMMTEPFRPEFARGLRWNDPAFGISWPDDERTILDRDNCYPDFGPPLVTELEKHW